MDKTRFISDSQSLLEQLLGAPFASQSFYVLLGTYVLVLAIVGKLLTSSIAGSNRGIIACTIGLLLPCILAISSYAAALQYLPHWITNPDTITNLSFGTAVFFKAFTILFITPFFLGTGIFRTIIISILASVIAAGAVFLLGNNLTFVENDTKLSWRQTQSLSK